jgi:hypothetical protein
MGADYGEFQIKNQRGFPMQRLFEPLTLVNVDKIATKKFLRQLGIDDYFKKSRQIGAGTSS